MTDLQGLLERVRTAKGPDGEIDYAIYRQLREYTGLQSYTASIDAALALTERVLPGWCWRIGTCCVSDDAWVAPDWNSPVHGARLRQELGEPVYGSVFDQGVDIDRRPPGNLPLAILEALLSALIEQKESAK